MAEDRTPEEGEAWWDIHGNPYLLISAPSAGDDRWKAAPLPLVRVKANRLADPMGPQRPTDS